MGLLVKREFFRPTAQVLAEGAARLGPGAAYYTLTLGGGPIGYVTSTIDTTATGFTVQSNMVMDIQVERHRLLLLRPAGDRAVADD